MAHTYAKVPALSNVWENEAPGASVPEFQAPVEVWATAPLFVHCTVSPTSMVTDPGLNEKSTMDTVTVSGESSTVVVVPAVVDVVAGVVVAVVVVAVVVVAVVVVAVVVVVDGVVVGDVVGLDEVVVDEAAADVVDVVAEVVVVVVATDVVQAASKRAKATAEIEESARMITDTEDRSGSVHGVVTPR